MGGGSTAPLIIGRFAGTGQFELFGSFPVYGVLTLSYTAEPGTIVLLGSGIAGLAAFGRRKRRG